MSVIVQTMVYGNMNEQSGSAVVLTRNPLTGISELSGEYLVTAEGDDLVGGKKTPVSLHIMRESNPETFETMSYIAKSLEKHFRQAQVPSY